MVHITLANVLVRVDDLDDQERKRVARVQCLIKSIEEREGQRWFFSFRSAVVMMIAVAFTCVLFLSSSSASVPYVAHWPFWTFMTSAAIVILVILVGATLRTLNIFPGPREREKDIFDLGIEVKLSPRCRQLLDVYVAMHPSFGQRLPQELLTPRTA